MRVTYLPVPVFNLSFWRSVLLQSLRLSNQVIGSTSV